MAYLLDSNILIYAAYPEHKFLRDFIRDRQTSVSEISKIEVLGFSKISPMDRHAFELYFEEARTWPVTSGIINLATILRQQKKMSLGDAVIAATAIMKGLTLLTRNAKDFNHIDLLRVENPFELVLN